MEQGLGNIVELAAQAAFGDVPYPFRMRVPNMHFNSGAMGAVGQAARVKMMSAVSDLGMPACCQPENHTHRTHQVQRKVDLFVESD